MAQYYFRAVDERGRENKLAAVCFQMLENGKPSGNFTILLTDEWGEKEILRKMKSVGLFEADDSFMPVGPNVGGDLRLIVDRASHHGLLKWDEGTIGQFLERKRKQMTPPPVASGTASPAEVQGSAKRESNRQLIERLRKEAESFISALSTPL